MFQISQNDIQSAIFLEYITEDIIYIVFFLSWNNQQFPNDKYDQMAYPKSQLGELGQL